MLVIWRLNGDLGNEICNMCPDGNKADLNTGLGGQGGGGGVRKGGIDTHWFSAWVSMLTVEINKKKYAEMQDFEYIEKQNFFHVNFTDLFPTDAQIMHYQMDTYFHKS